MHETLHAQSAAGESFLTPVSMAAKISACFQDFASLKSKTFSQLHRNEKNNNYVMKTTASDCPFRENYDQSTDI